MKSMTGFGRSKFEENSREYIVEIKSVNHKYSDISIKLPRNIMCFEEKIKKIISNNISRGKVDVFVTFNNYSDEGKDVIIIGGGDTGNDCCGTCIRLGAKSVTQLEMMPKPPEERLPSNPWPEWPRILKVDYGQEESIYKFGRDPRVYQTTVKEFIKDKKGNLKEVVLIKLESKKDEKTGRFMMVPVEGTEETVPCQLVLIAAGFLGSEKYVTDDFGVELDARTNVKTDNDKHASSVAKIYAAGDVRSGQSLVVRAIADGRKAAREVDLELMGYTNL